MRNGEGAATQRVRALLEAAITRSESFGDDHTLNSPLESIEHGVARFNLRDRQFFTALITLPLVGLPSITPRNIRVLTTCGRQTRGRK